MQKMLQGAAGGGSPNMQWKSALHETLQKNSNDEKPAYECEEAEGGKYLGTVTIGGETYTAEKPAKKKKEAEQFAAMAAFKTLYPAEFKNAAAGSGGGGMPAMMQMMGGAKGQKRKADGLPSHHDPKGKLGNSIQLLITSNHARSMTKEDVKWETAEFEENGTKTYQVSVTINDSVGPEGGKTFNGEVCDNKKAAEASAAQVAYDSMKSILEPLEEEHKAKKQKKKEEEAEAWKQKLAEKKAAKAAGTDAA